jgi:hypothetical protein
MKSLEWSVRRLAPAVLLVGLLIWGGCAGKQKEEKVGQIDPRSEIEGTQKNGPSGGEGHPFRLIAFVIHPVGLLVDYVVVRPVYFIASLAPGLFGYTAEDQAALEKDRSAR